MTELGLLAGLDPRVVADMDTDEFMALSTAVDDQRQAEAWTSLHELGAATVEALWAVLSRLEAGIMVVEAQRLRQPSDRGRYPRPDWLKDEASEDVIVLTDMREVVRVLRPPRGGV